MKTNRQRIIEYLQDNQTASAVDLSRYLGVTPANIRHHLSILMEQGSIEIVGQTPSIGRGRPAALYSLLRPTLQHNLAILADALLDQVLADLPLCAVNKILHQIVFRLCQGLSQPYKNPTQRMYLAIAYINKMNYRAHWEAHVEAPRIMLENCPYKAILNKHPELCHLDELLLEELLGLPVILVEKLMPTSKGIRQCIFLAGSK